jgi:DNA primase
MVANPYAPQLTFLDDRTRTRRDFPKYLTLIRTIALLHQHQRPVRTVQHGDATLEYVEVTVEDVEIANRLAAAVLGRSLDELPPQTRRLLHQVELWVGRECAAKQLKKDAFRFTRREAREALRFSDTQLRLHLGRLVELELLSMHRVANGFAYELRYEGEGKDGAPFLPGLVDVETLRGHQYDSKLAGVNAHLAVVTGQLAGASRAGNGGIAAPSRPTTSGESTNGFHSLAADGTAASANAHLDLRNGAASYTYPQGRR